MNERDEAFGFTALMLAAGGGHLDVLKVLLAAGADPNASGGVAHVGFYTPLTMAMSRRNKNRMEMIDALIAAGAEVNPPESHPESPLGRAVKERDLEMLRALLKRGADVNWRNGIGDTALVTAVTYDEWDLGVIRLLLKAGADPNRPRLWAGDECVSILSYLYGWRGTSRDKTAEEIRRLLRRSGAKRFRSKNTGGVACKQG